ncbi:MAG: hypothetical protein NT096_09765 [Proteobacteria bacterium]|nr:hypothetical protein [Pseudomonadota bacterium]
MRVSFVTKEVVDGAQRKIAWFAWQPKGLYYDVGGLLWGSHISYHVDGNVFRTSPATGGRPRFQGRQLPLTGFAGWHQLGIAMINKQMLAKNPPLKSRDQKPGNVVNEVPILALETDTPNIVIELVHDDQRHLLALPQFQPPPGASQHEARIGHLGVIVTVIGSEAHLLVKPIGDGVRVQHINDRFTANAKGVTYTFEAYD